MNNNLVGRKVKYLKQHTPIFLPGYGNIGDTLPAQGKTMKLDMTFTGDGVRIDINGVDTVFLHGAQCPVIMFERQKESE